jgi:hypothetical protein
MIFGAELTTSRRRSWSDLIRLKIMRASRISDVLFRRLGFASVSGPPPAQVALKPL